MAEDTQEKGFAVTPARVAFVLSLIGVVTFGWQIAAHATANDFTLRAHGEYIAEDKQNTKEILAELKDLNKKVDRLAFTIDANAITKDTAFAPRPK